MIGITPVAGFEAGAHSLRDYDLFADGLLQSNMKTLLVAGEKDAVLFEGMKSLAEEWATNGDVRFAEISGIGHIPVLDGAERWLDAIVRFLEE
jgi:pimeloyl-ACP methyl ester carboxylesterase